jgi:8-oxo-dGTP diphosphatase
MRRHLLAKVGVTRVGHLEQLDSTASAGHPSRPVAARPRAPGAHPQGCETDLPPDTEWHPVDALPSIAFGHAARSRARTSG